MFRKMSHYYEIGKVKNVISIGFDYSKISL